MTGIVTLPQEIISTITDYLDRRDRLRLATTCHSLYKALLSQLWKEVYIQSAFPHFQDPRIGERVDIPPDRPIITSSRLELHAPLVQHLSLHGPFPQEYHTIVFPYLHILGLYLDTSYHAPFDDTQTTFSYALDASMRAEQYRHRAALIRQNPTIKDLRIQVREPQPTADFWDTISTTLVNPTRLVVMGLRRTEGETLDAFWRACSLFEEIHCSADSMDSTRILSQLSFPRLLRVSLRSSVKFQMGFCTRSQLVWLRRCPGLTRLHWKFDSFGFPSSMFAEALEQGTWPSLDDLSLEKLGDGDDDLAAMSAHLPPLRSFRLRSKRFGPLTFNTLRARLFNTIRVLDLTGNDHFTSRMALDVLRECVHLERFHGVTIIAQEIDNEQRPWVCLGLKRLATIIVSGTDASSRAVFGALSRLTELESLDLDMGLEDWKTAHVVPSGMYRLPWNLEHGLGQLSTLTKLRTVTFGSTVQAILTDKDVEWTAENLPALEEVKGRLCLDAERHEKLARVLGRRGVLHVDH
ncbi:hypothetical protein KI688_010646 [Linnemannia hyalina]|uniref:F-box domain-containing protein n=1 Tax=Linnemannia hyalina TaxID=64524 RepID=A0A9P8BUN5_9FUNG|nr:hypothetical protein KI688_010646 [Linnemannia hyalina]